MKHTTTRRPARLAAVVAIAVAAAGLAGCSGTSSSSSSSGGSDAITTINWWSWNPDSTTDEQWISLFEQENPTIKVNFRFIENTDYQTTVRMAANTSSGPDVFGLQTGAMATQLAPLTVDLGPLAAKDIGSDWTDQLIATDQFQVDGSQVALPWMISGGGELWYNKTQFDQVGITAPPTDLSSWKDDCTKLQAINVTCFVQGAKDDWVNLDVYQIIANQINPGEFYKAIVGQTPFDSPDFVKAFDAWNNLFTSGIVQPGALAMTTYPQTMDMVLKGQANMIALGSWNNDRMTTALLDNLAPTDGDQLKSQVFVPAPFPDVVGGAQETGRLFGGPDVGWAISAKSEHQDAAWTFLKWLVSSQTAQQKMATTLEQPALKSVTIPTTGLSDPDVQTPIIADQSAQLANLIGPRQIDNADVSAALATALSSVASGQESSADAAKAVQAAIDTATSAQ